MTQQNVTFEAAGNVNGATISPTTTSFDFVTIAAGGAAVLSTSDKAHGSFGGRFSTGATAASCYGQKNFPSGTSAQFSTSAVVTLPSAVAASDIQLLSIRNQNSDAKVFSVNLRTNGDLAIQDATGTYTQIVPAASLTLGGQYRIQIVGTIGSTTSNGAFTAKAFLQSTGAQVGSTASSTTANLSAGGFAFHYRAGIVASVASASAGFDDVQINDGTTTPIGDLAVNTTPPTVTAGASQTFNTPAPTVSLTSTATAAGTSFITGYQWQCTSYPAGSSAPSILNSSSADATSNFLPANQNPTVALPAGVRGRWIFQVTAIDSDGNTASASTKVFVTNTTISVLEITSNAAAFTGAVSALNDASDSTYMESLAPTGSPVTLVLRLNPLQASPAGFSLDIRDLLSAAGGTASFALLEGATVRKDWGAQTPGTTAGDTILTLTGGEIAAIGSWNELDLRVTWQ